MKSLLFFNVAHPRLVVSYRHFGTTYRSHLRGSSIRRLLEHWRWDR